MRRAQVAGAAVVAAAAMTLAGCNLDPRTATLPGGVATGGNGYTVTAVFSDADNLVPNAEVQYENVRIGTVRTIELDRRTWDARIQISVEKSVRLPANVTAKIGQKSLLGAEYVELDRPVTPSHAALAANDVIPLGRTGDYPETEDVLSAASLLLNDGGLAQLKTITTQLNAALHGREGTARDLLDRLNTFVGRINAQKTDLVATISRLNSLSATLADNRDTVARALTHITPAVTTLETDRSDLTTALAALDKLGVTATSVIRRNKQGLATDLSLLRPTLKKLAQAGSALPRSLPILPSFPFPVTTIDRTALGDYTNVYVELNLTNAALSRDFGLDAKDSGIAADSSALQQELAAVLGSSNPLTAPMHTPKAARAAGSVRSGSSSGGGSTSSSSSGGGSTSGSGASAGSPGASGSTGSAPAPAPSGSSSCTLLNTLLGGC